MPEYLVPDVYVEEIRGGPRPIEAVGSGVAGFVGVAPKANAHLNEAVAINNSHEFVKEFSGDGDASTHLSHAIFGFLLMAVAVAMS